MPKGMTPEKANADAFIPIVGDLKRLNGTNPRERAASQIGQSNPNKACVVFKDIVLEDVAGRLLESGSAGQTKPVALFGDDAHIFEGVTPGAKPYPELTAGSIAETETPAPIGRATSKTNIRLSKTP